MRVALYTRVSTRDKDQNPETQLLRLCSRCCNPGRCRGGKRPNKPEWL